MINEKLMFAGMIFGAVFMLVQGLAIATDNKKAEKSIRRRMGYVIEKNSNSTTVNLLKKRRGTVKWMKSVQRLIEHSGKDSTLSSFVTISAVLASCGSVGGYLFTHTLLLSAPIGVGVGSLPFLRLRRAYNKKLLDFEAQLPDAIDIMVRSLRAGYPFNETLSLIADEMKSPISKEFKTTFLDINYGTDVKLAFYSLMERVPSTNLLNLVTAVLIQRESGGNLTEVLEKISSIIRANFRFKRQVKTLSAEGRLSAWILASVPFALVILLMIISPTYIPMLTKDSLGIKISIGSFCLMMSGIFWISQLLKKVGEV